MLDTSPVNGGGKDRNEQTQCHMRVIGAISMIATSAMADNNFKTTYQATFDFVSQKPDCVRKDYPDFILFDCTKSKNPAAWYFTKPDSPAHPGVLERSFSAKAIDTDAYSWGPDDAQPAFKAWMDEIGHAIMGH
jgi:hypothetical protein